MADSRQSDRWVTPGVIIVFLLVGGVLVLAAMAAVTYLAARGVDPDPMVQLVADVATAVGALAAAGVTIATRATTAKVERNTGVQANELAAVRDEVAELRAAEADRTRFLPGTVPAPPGR